jgi:ATP-dependent helicase/nuclease subunit B
MPLIDSLCDEFSDCKFEPVFFELSIDKTSDKSPEPSIFRTADGREIYFSGKVDRVDTYRSGDDVYVRVIDYKTGAKDFKPSDIEEGKNLQMFLYLKAIVESEKESFRSAIGISGNGKMIPAGVIYVKANVSGSKIQKDDADEAIKAAKKNQEREGMLLNDCTSIGAMNSKFIPVKFKNDGNPDAYSVAKLYTIERWGGITDTIKKIVSDECTKMVLGDICAKPLREKRGKSSVCKWCEFKPICRNSNAPADDEE